MGGVTILNCILIALCVGECLSAVTHGRCVDNIFISKLDLVEPAHNERVLSPYYTKMSAEVKMDIGKFKDLQDEFSICVNASISSDAREQVVYSECGRSVFGQGLVLGQPGINRLHVSLMHRSTPICEVDTVVQCCLGADAISAMEAEKKHMHMAIFMELGQEMVTQLSGLIPTIQAMDPALGRYQSLLSAWNGAEEQHSMIVLVGIKSGALNLVKRNSIRASWLRYTDPADLLAPEGGIHFLPVFVIGESPLMSNATVAEVLSTEQQFYGDTLLQHQIPVSDSYFTLTEKLLAFANWTYMTTPAGVTVDYVVMCDDGVFVDVWQLENHLRGLAGRQRYYAGEVLEVRMGDTYKPIRDPNHRNYLSKANYPLDTLPPFALGNFYILSGDLWEYIQRNAAALRPVGTLEDLSVGVWMMGVQVFPMHLSGACDITRCLYDREVYKASDIPSSQRLLAVADLHQHTDFELLFRLTEYRRAHGLANTQVGLDATLATVKHIFKQKSGTDTSGAPNPGEGTLTTAPVPDDNPSSTGPSRTVALVLATNALYGMELIEALLISVLPDANIGHRYLAEPIKGSAEWLVHEIDAQRHLLRTLSATDVAQLSAAGSHTVLIVSVLDCAEADTQAQLPSEHWRWTDSSEQRLAYLRSALGAERVVLVSGESLNLSSLSSNSVDLLITATTRSEWQPAGVRHVYVPVFSTALYELNANSPTVRYAAEALLVSVAQRSTRDHTGQSVPGSALATARRPRGVAYLYHRCDRPLRERLFDVLREALPPGYVRALGKCHGSADQAPDTNAVEGDAGAVRAPLASRFTRSYLSEAVRIYEDFDFVVAVENSAVEGYVTEKLLTAFLAGAVPIYFGAPDVLRYVNPAAMVYCGAGEGEESLRACAGRVKELLAQPGELERMRAEPPILNTAAWSVLFPWERVADGSSAAVGAFMDVLRESLA